MQLVALVLLVCSISSPDACQERRMLFESHGSLEQCMVEAVPFMAQWAGLHPDVHIARWRCEWPDAVDQKS